MKKVVVGMSGGVDSSVAALLLKEKGYDVVGLHMKNRDSALSDEDEFAVKQICQKLNIKFEVIEFSNQMDIVKKYFLNEYKSGRTPNPCVICNKEVKFSPFIDFADKIGADFFATGHYANTNTTDDGITHLLKAKDKNKDQTYFLNQLNQKQLSRALFPIGNMFKPDLRIIAENAGLVSAHKKDSFDLCFVGNSKFKDFMRQSMPQKNGLIVDIDSGKTVGEHHGIVEFTFGQRRGLNVGGQREEEGRWFVVKKDFENNILFVSNKQEKYLYSSELIASNVNWISYIPPQKEFDCFAKCRYRQLDQKVHVTLVDGGCVKVHFYETQRAITVGQYVVFYSDTECLGGGMIEKTYNA